MSLDIIAPKAHLEPWPFQYPAASPSRWGRYQLPTEISNTYVCHPDDDARDFAMSGHCRFDPWATRFRTYPAGFEVS